MRPIGPLTILAGAAIVGLITLVVHATGHVLAAVTIFVVGGAAAAYAFQRPADDVPSPFSNGFVVGAWLVTATPACSRRR